MDIKDLKAALEQKYQIKVLAVYLIGSVARKTATEDSDFNISFIFVNDLKKYLSIREPVQHIHDILVQRDPMITHLAIDGVTRQADVRGYDIRFVLQKIHCWDFRTYSLLWSEQVGSVNPETTEQHIISELNGLARSCMNPLALASEAISIARSPIVMHGSHDKRIYSNQALDFLWHTCQALLFLHGLHGSFYFSDLHSTLSHVIEFGPSYQLSAEACDALHLIYHEAYNAKRTDEMSESTIKLMYRVLEEVYPQVPRSHNQKHRPIEEFDRLLQLAINAPI